MMLWDLQKLSCKSTLRGQKTKEPCSKDDCPTTFLQNTSAVWFGYPTSFFYVSKKMDRISICCKVYACFGQWALFKPETESVQCRARSRSQKLTNTENEHNNTTEQARVGTQNPLKPVLNHFIRGLHNRGFQRLGLLYMHGTVTPSQTLLIRPFVVEN